MVSPRIEPTRVMSRYSRAFRELARLTGFSPKQVLLAEAGSVLKTWAGRTKVATQGEVDRRSRLHAVRSLGYTQGSERGDVTVNAGFRPAPYGRVWIRVREGAGRNQWILAKGPNFSAPSGRATFTLTGRQLYNPRNRGDTDRSTSYQWMQNVDYAQKNVEHKLPVSLAKGRRAIGLSRQSVVQIADDLGIDLASVPGGGVSPAGLAKARAAMASNGRSYRNGLGQVGGDASRAFVDLINRLPHARKIGMDRALLGVLAGRVKLFERAYGKGVFLSQHNIARAYPNLLRVRAA